MSSAEAVKRSAFLRGVEWREKSCFSFFFCAGRLRANNPIPRMQSGWITILELEAKLRGIRERLPRKYKLHSVGSMSSLVVFRQIDFVLGLFCV